MDTVFIHVNPSLFACGLVTVNVKLAINCVCKFMFIYDWPE